MMLQHQFKFTTTTTRVVEVITFSIYPSWFRGRRLLNRTGGVCAGEE